MQSFVSTIILLHFLCLFTEECTQAEQLGAGTVLIESEISVCFWRTDGSGLDCLGHGSVSDHMHTKTQKVEITAGP